jgi:hypothetical protein
MRVLIPMIAIGIALSATHIFATGPEEDELSTGATRFWGMVCEGTQLELWTGDSAKRGIQKCSRPVAGAVIEVRTPTRTIASFETEENGKFDLLIEELGVDEKTTVVFRGTVKGLMYEELLERGKENIILAKLPKKMCKKKPPN